MLIAITIASILVLTGLVTLINRLLPFAICPICTGSFLTWTGLVGAHFAGYEIDLVIPALLMGGSVVGIAYQLEKRARRVSAGVLLFWKTLFIPAGFVATYAVLMEWWTVLLLAITFLFLSAFAFLFPRGTTDSRTETSDNLEKKMEDCC